MLSAGLITSALVSTVMMTTLVVGRSISRARSSSTPASVGLVMSMGPLVAALIGAPAGRAVDRLGATRMVLVGLIGVMTGSIGLSSMPAGWGVPGYVVPLVVITASYALFQAANNTGLMSNVRSNHRGLVSGMVNLSRNLGLITGASVMGAVFAFASGTSDITMARPEDIATGTRWTFAVAATLIAVGLAVAMGIQTLPRRSSTPQRTRAGSPEVRRIAGPTFK